jgi:hypothetical protein
MTVNAAIAPLGGIQCYNRCGAAICGMLYADIASSLSAGTENLIYTTTKNHYQNFIKQHI